MMSQNRRRASGSTPPVGSSRKTTGGRCRRAGRKGQAAAGSLPEGRPPALCVGTAGLSSPTPTRVASRRPCPTPAGFRPRTAGFRPPSDRCRAKLLRHVAESGLVWATGRDMRPVVHFPDRKSASTAARIRMTVVLPAPLDPENRRSLPGRPRRTYAVHGCEISEDLGQVGRRNHCFRGRSRSGLKGRHRPTARRRVVSAIQALTRVFTCAASAAVRSAWASSSSDNRASPAA